MLKVVFLDIDGVLNSYKWIKETRPSLEEKDYHLWFDPGAVGLLNTLTDKTDAKIVVSSTWRTLVPYNDLVALLKAVGVTGEVIGVTSLYGGERGNEIQGWLDEHPVESFVILDDDDDMVHLSPFLVRTTFIQGLMPCHIETAIKILEGNNV